MKIGFAEHWKRVILADESHFEVHGISIKVH